MILHSPYPPPSISTFKPNTLFSSNRTEFSKPTTKILNRNAKHGQESSNSSPKRDESDDRQRESILPDYFRGPRLRCCCGRRGLIGAIGTTTLLSIPPSNASPSLPDPKAMLKAIHPPRPDWYEELYASALDTGMKSYEAEVAGYKSQLFANVRGKAETVLEIGIGAGPNLKYYAGDKSGVRIVGIDPNRKMEKYAQAAALNVGLPPADFKFIHAVAESLPLRDASVDAVVGTLVLCSVKDVNMALKEVMRVLKPGGLYFFLEHVAAKDGTVTRFVQGVLDPLQQTVSDGCHLTRTTGNYISEAGFSNVDLKNVFVSNAYFLSPHVYGIACK
ncbi:hypothetical protein Vadar_023015 [Vaccinium darrowii]|uniref:Uncharacterized protein n=1 Tax=Vaccinium darrowii TaxID=229202 RepID=A0ACB7X358_9ERIC|nr:hypothetical protein Vadar_023015 [Vaccinium darrowii]